MAVAGGLRSHRGRLGISRVPGCRPWQAPSFYRYNVGDAQVNVVSDGVNNFALPANGYVAKDGNGYRLVPAPWSPVI